MGQRSITAMTFKGQRSSALVFVFNGKMEVMTVKPGFDFVLLVLAQKEVKQVTLSGT